MVTRTDLTTEPYCSNCGYVLTGLTESAKCPECGKPLVEILTRNSNLRRCSRRYRSKATLFGLPVIDIAIGPSESELRGKAKGIIAIGDIATGGIAIGGVAMGLVSIGGVAVGGCALGGCSLGLLTALGGLAIGGMAVGGGAIGILATGGGGLGVAAQGGGAFGVFVRDARTPASGPYPEIFDTFSWFFGSWPMQSSFQPLLAVLVITAAFAALIAIPALLRLLKDEPVAKLP